MHFCQPVIIASTMLFAATAAQADQYSDTQDAAREYRAALRAVNPEFVAGGGRVDIRLADDQLHIAMTVENLTPNMVHMQHLHGSREGMRAECPPMSRAALDGETVDLLDSQRYSGITLIPLHDDPVSLEIKSDTYPRTDESGGYTYDQKVSWTQLQKAVEKEYGIANLNLEQLVIYVHGVPADTDLPESTRSLEGAPAHLTLPVACGEIKAWDPQEGAGLIEQ